MIPEIRPIRAGEWLPDRCMAITMPMDPRASTPQFGCPSLRFGGSHIQNRAEFEEFYGSVLSRFGCCGFVAWEDGGVVGYSNFFPHEIARELRFYGWGKVEGEQSGVLIHHCISVIQNSSYRHKGIGTQLIVHSLKWAKRYNWKSYEVHNVLPDVGNAVAAEQKAVLSFWKKFGFAVLREEEADAETKSRYGVKKRYSLALNVDEFDDTAFGGLPWELQEST